MGVRDRLICIRNGLDGGFIARSLRVGSGQSEPGVLWGMRTLGMTRSGERAAKTVHDPVVGVAGRRGGGSGGELGRGMSGRKRRRVRRRLRETLNLGEQRGRSSRHPMNPKLSSFGLNGFGWISAGFCRLTACCSAQHPGIVLKPQPTESIIIALQV